MRGVAVEPSHTARTWRRLGSLRSPGSPWRGHFLTGNSQLNLDLLLVQLLHDSAQKDVVHRSHITEGDEAKASGTQAVRVEHNHSIVHLTIPLKILTKRLLVDRWGQPPDEYLLHLRRVARRAVIVHSGHVLAWHRLFSLHLRGPRRGILGMTGEVGVSACRSAAASTTFKSPGRGHCRPPDRDPICATTLPHPRAQARPMRGTLPGGAGRAGTVHYYGKVLQRSGVAPTLPGRECRGTTGGRARQRCAPPGGRWYVEGIQPCLRRLGMRIPRNQSRVGDLCSCRS
mmetsp:Transcript_40005/g.100617  ORF Transcript_40005/g.100617 Transcript_40005/m.100617 type:complete len:286 (-) Transcript_40005:793-1650(-)